MAILRTSEIRTMTVEERADELETLKMNWSGNVPLLPQAELLKTREESEKSGERLPG